MEILCQLIERIFVLIVVATSSGDRTGGGLWIEYCRSWDSDRTGVRNVTTGFSSWLRSAAARLVCSAGENDFWSQQFCQVWRL